MAFLKLCIQRPSKPKRQQLTTKKSKLSKLINKLRKVKECLHGSASPTTGTGTPEIDFETKGGTKPPAMRLRYDSTQLNESTSPLLRLPAELRNQIYEYVLGEKSICLTSRDEIPIGEIAPRRTPPASCYGPADIERGVLELLTVCRQINIETRQLPFTLNVFRYSNALRDLETWKRWKPECLSLVRSVRLYSNGFNNEEIWIEGLTYFPNLKNLEVAVHYLRPPSNPLDFKTSAFDALRNWESDLKTRARAVTHDQLRVVFYHR